MPTYFPASIFPTQFTNPDNGELASGFTLEAQLAGTSTPTNMFTDKNGTVAGTSITLNSGGWPEVSGSIVTIWLQQNVEYKFILRDNDSNIEYTIDNLTGYLSDVNIYPPVADYATFRTNLANGEYAVGTVIEVLSPSGPPFEVKQGVETDDGMIIITENGGTTIAGQYYAERSYTGDPNAMWGYVENGSDIGVTVNTLTAKGLTSIYVPAGQYTQSTAFTTDQALTIYSDFWDEFGTPPAIFTKDADITHISTQGQFTSLGIRYDGNDVAGGSDGVIIRGKFHFIGQVVSQTGNGLVLREEASDNLNNSIFGGAFSGNDLSQVLLEVPSQSNTNNIDVNTILSKYIRCNSGRVGLHVKGGLYNEWQYINTKGNTEIGVLIEAENAVSNNTFRIYSENTATGVIDFYAVDGWTVFGGTPSRTGDTTFTVTGDQTSTFTAGKKIRCTDNGVIYWGTIDSSVFSSVTTVTVTMAGNVALTANLTEVATDAAANNFRDNDFLHGRGLTKDDVYIENGNVFLQAGARQGIMSNAEQPWVKAYVSSDQSNVTGNGTAYTVPFDTETKDTQGNYDNSTYTYTAPTTGRYRFEGSVRLQGLSVGNHTRCILELVTTGTTYILYDLNLDNFKSASNVACLPFSITASMSSNNTAFLRLTISNGALDVDIGGAAGQTWMDIVFEG